MCSRNSQTPRGPFLPREGERPAAPLPRRGPFSSPCGGSRPLGSPPAASLAPPRRPQALVVFAGSPRGRPASPATQGRGPPASQHAAMRQSPPIPEHWDDRATGATPQRSSIALAARRAHGPGPSSSTPEPAQHTTAEPTPSCALAFPTDHNARHVHTVVPFPRGKRERPGPRVPCHGPFPPPLPGPPPTARTTANATITAKPPGHSGGLASPHLGPRRRSLHVPRPTTHDELEPSRPGYAAMTAARAPAWAPPAAAPSLRGRPGPCLTPPRRGPDPSHGANTPPVWCHNHPMTEQWDVAQVAAELNVKPSTVRSYLARGQMPPADGRIGRSPWWHPHTITTWPRPGQGRRRTPTQTTA